MNDTQTKMYNSQNLPPYMDEELTEQYLKALEHKLKKNADITLLECDAERFAEILLRSVSSERTLFNKRDAAEGAFKSFVLYLKLQTARVGEKENDDEEDKLNPIHEDDNKIDTKPKPSGKDLHEWALKPSDRSRILKSMNPTGIKPTRYKPLCSTDLPGAVRVLADRVMLKKRIGGDSVNGEAFVACVAKCSKNSGKGKCIKMECDAGSGVPDVAVKVAPLSEAELKHLNNPLSPSALSRTTFSEMLANMLCHYLVVQNICPNLPLIYDVYHCKNCKFENARILQRKWKNTYPNRYMRLAGSSNVIKKKKDGLTFKDVQTSAEAKKEGLTLDCVFILNEFANDGSTIQFLEKYIRHSAITWMSFMFQYLAGLASVQKWFHMLHYDTHLGNFLVHKAPTMKKTYFKYTLDGHTYYVPTSGYLFVVWDFGLCYIPGLVTNQGYKNFREKVERTFGNAYAFDVSRPMAVLLGANEKPYIEARKHIPPSVIPFMQRIMTNRTLNAQQLIAELFKKVFSKPPSGMTMAGEYNLDKRPELPNELQRFLAK